MSRVTRINLLPGELAALIKATETNGGEPAAVGFGPTGAWLLPTKGGWQRWALEILAEMREVKV